MKQSLSQLNFNKKNMNKIIKKPPEASLVNFAFKAIEVILLC
jgi:hypothetical protein